MMTQTTGIPGCMMICFEDSTGERTAEVHCIRQIHDSITVNMINTPIVTYTAENAFTFDTGATQTYTVSFTRVLPTEVDDSATDQRQWSNRKWKEHMTDTINRWQAESDGCRLVYLPPTGADRQAIPDGLTDGVLTDGINVYIKNLSFDLTADLTDAITGSFTAAVCSMKGDASSRLMTAADMPSREPVKRDEMSILMTSSDGLLTYALYLPKRGINCISSAVMRGGAVQPFEYIEITLKKNRMKTYCEYLIDDMIPGRNRITYNVCGSGEFILTSVKTSGRDIKITAFSVYEQYRGIKLSDGGLSDLICTARLMSDYDSPAGIIRRVLCNTYFGIDGNKLYIPPANIHFHVDFANNVWFAADEDMAFKIPGDATVWQTVRICAAMLHANVFISDNNVYVVDRRMPSVTDGAPLPDCVSDCVNDRAVDSLSRLIVSKRDHDPETVTDDEEAVMTSIVGTASLGSEGSNTLFNYAIMTDGNTEYPSDPLKSDTRVVDRSLDVFRPILTKVEFSNIVSPGGTYTDGHETVIGHIGYALSETHCDVSQSMTVEMAETCYLDEGGRTSICWCPAFPELWYAGLIYDPYNEVLIRPKMNFMIRNTMDTQWIDVEDCTKTFVSMYEHRFPEMTTAYTFGQVEQADLTQALSQIMSNRL